MSTHLKKRFNESEVVEILERYICGEMTATMAQDMLNIKRSRFFSLLKSYRDSPLHFTLAQKRTTPGRSTPQHVEDKILEHLQAEKKLISDKTNPIHRYNYSYVKSQLQEKDDIKVSLSTIIRRAKKMDFINLNEQENIMIEKCNKLCWGTCAT